MSVPHRSKGREYLEALIIAVIFLKFANAFVLQTFYIPSESMLETLLVGDHLFVNRFIYGEEALPVGALLPSRPVERGDVVIFRSPEPPHVDVVKRCVAVAGDVVEVRAKQLYLNGVEVDDESYTLHTEPGAAQLQGIDRVRAYRRDNFGPFEVPEGHYFCMGDNRDNSHDSRFWGPLPAHLVKGRALVIYWSFHYSDEDRKTLGDDGGAGLVARLRRLGRTAVGFFVHTRWGRTLHLIR